MKIRRLPALLFLCASVRGTAASDRDPDAIQAKYGEANQAFTKAEEIAQAEYRKRIAELFASADKAVIYLLDFETKPADPSGFGWWLDNDHGGSLPNELFPIQPETATSQILSRRALGPADIRKLALPLSAMVAKDEDGVRALCHFPIHGLRLWRKDTLLFESSFCWTCGNYYMAYPNHTSRWRSVTPELQKAMTALLPIPPKETDRFQKAYPKASPLDRGLNLPK